MNNDAHDGRDGNGDTRRWVQRRQPRGGDRGSHSQEGDMGDALDWVVIEMEKGTCSLRGEGIRNAANINQPKLRTTRLSRQSRCWWDCSSNGVTLCESSLVM